MCYCKGKNHRVIYYGSSSKLIQPLRTKSLLASLCPCHNISYLPACGSSIGCLVMTQEKNKQNPYSLESQDKIFLPQSFTSFLSFCITNEKQDLLRQNEDKYFVDKKMHENYVITKVRTMDQGTKQESQHPENKSRKQEISEALDHQGELY